jgi:hypothetical protein
MIPKSGYRFSEKITLKLKTRMIPKSGYRFSEKIMLKLKTRMIPKSGYRFPAFAKPASAGEGKSEKIMIKPRNRQARR